MFKFVVLLALLPAILARTPVRECAGHPKPDAVFFSSRESPCLAEPCNVIRSQGYAVTYVDFTTRSAASSILPRVRATVFGITFVQELPDIIQQNPCGILTEGFCPLGESQKASYRLELPVDPLTPTLSTETEITLFGDDGEVIFCYKLQSRVVA